MLSIFCSAHVLFLKLLGIFAYLHTFWQHESGRPAIPRKKDPLNMEDQNLISDHPYVDKLWHIHNAEQMILDHEEENPDKYRDKKYESTVDLSFDVENSVEHTTGYYKKVLLPKTVLKTDIKELDLDAARAERQLIKKLQKEAEERGEEYKVDKLRRNREMDEYDLMHWRRSLEEREALIRDISCRKVLGLPIEEPGRYDLVDEKKIWGKDFYDPKNPLFRYDYWGEPKNSEKSKLDKMIKDHNDAIMGGGTPWYEMSYEVAMAQKERLEAEEKARAKEEVEEEPREGKEDDDDDDDDDIDFDYSIFEDLLKYKPVPNASVHRKNSDDLVDDDSDDNE